MKNKKIDKGTIAIYVFLSLLIMFVFYLIIKRKKELNDDFTITKASITEIIIDAPKSTVTTMNIAKYTFIHNNKRYNDFAQIYSRKITTGDCFEVKVANKNPNNHKINFEKKIPCNELSTSLN